MFLLVWINNSAKLWHSREFLCFLNLCQLHEIEISPGRRCIRFLNRNTILCEYFPPLVSLTVVAQWLILLKLCRYSLGVSWNILHAKTSSSLHQVCVFTLKKVTVGTSKSKSGQVRRATSCSVDVHFNMYFVYLVENQILKPPTPSRLRMMLVFADIPTFQCQNLWGLPYDKTHLLIFAWFNVTAIVIAIVYFAVKHASAVAHLSSAINKFAQQFCAQFITCSLCRIGSNNFVSSNLKIAHHRVNTCALCFELWGFGFGPLCFLCVLIASALHF